MHPAAGKPKFVHLEHDQMMTACLVKLQTALATANKDKRTSFSAALIKLVQVLNSVGASLACLKSDV